ncbi:MAG TPA: DsbA family protein [Solirubrobacteraceae bacterium]|nr:DsbA family protein [Solirubrobacteraceae bacterium]
MGRPVFYYDLSSPYAYLAAARVDELLPVSPEWRPIAFGVIIRQTGKVPWSLQPDRNGDFEEIARRAAARGLPPVRYPEGWPVQTYSIIALRAALFVSDQRERRALSRAMFRTAFVDGRHLADLDTVLQAAAGAGLDAEAVRAGMERQEIKDALRAETEAAVSRGVTGVPTVAVGEDLFWGDDRLEDAATALAG